MIRGEAKVSKLYGIHVALPAGGGLSGRSVSLVDRVPHLGMSCAVLTLMLDGLSSKYALKVKSAP